jgi:hypothetical protein
VIKRLSLLLAAMFAFSMMFAAPVFASGDDDWNDGHDHGCFVHDDHGDHWWSNGNHDDDWDDDNGNHDDDKWWCDDNGDHNGDDWDDHNGDHNGDDWS